MMNIIGQAFQLGLGSKAFVKFAPRMRFSSFGFLAFWHNFSYGLFADLDCHTEQLTSTATQPISYAYFTKSLLNRMSN